MPWANLDFELETLTEKNKVDLKLDTTDVGCKNSWKIKSIVDYYLHTTENSVLKLTTAERVYHVNTNELSFLLITSNSSCRTDSLQRVLSDVPTLITSLLMLN